MAWNEPGGNNKDPWGGGNRNDGPPDLDELLRKLQQKLNNLFGGGSASGTGGQAKFPWALVLIVLAVLYGVWGFYQVNANEAAVVLRLGKYHSTQSAGLHWNPPLIDTVTKVNMTEVRTERTTGQMLTKDASIVDVVLQVQWHIDDAEAYVLRVRDPLKSLQEATDSALRHVVGSSSLNGVISQNRTKVSAETQKRLQRYLDLYQTGIRVDVVNLTDAKAPREVQDAFDDVVRAREDEVRLQNEAQAYANQVIPVARGQAQRMIEEAEAYKARVVENARGEAVRFEKLLAEYERAPEVTRERLYLDAVQEVMASASKVMVDIEGGNNMMYLPLDKLAEQSGTQALQRRDVSPQVVDEIYQRIVDRLRTEAANSRRSQNVR
ncbi:FtsH protease activity modulator HflK [Microbulbifer thermotolerans]|uniref:Protein HflK n=1 Tax=Microbulbifer thermotolerans TaxID=252514 RepID=A0A143HI69_MICTH|nr:FtsH protease activity modulator HflK [Microbulbifer thermotolerans]AMX01373.1 protease modulator HflK [Microbulbifer thermotolerans]MCX2782782.1 FtsH protease activity modulator HflK [Microbulbifer thermotolerans]MCX2795537.1 FtsH protease activity modulator HflK [Microbulbifer thermotolerans]MCX2831851.1 FtsH protease activity modulator HflK [Microbulbifer thermotolerans]MCX2835707.1 FtsH protease activity modulator HflK [Microbulbifer thermotolerans]